MRYVLDRIEGDIAVIEASDSSGITILKIPKKYLGGGAKEGGMLFFKDNIFYHDRNATESARREAVEKLRKLKKSE